MEVLHRKNEKSDKIWGYVLHMDAYLVFYGRANGTMSFIEHDNVSVFKMEKMARAKETKGYKHLYDSEWASVLPGDFDGQLMLAKLGMGLREAV